MTKARDISRYGLGVGIQSAGSVISGVGVTQLNFIGTGNTFRVSGGTVDISISGGGGIGIQSAGTQIGTGVTQLNFIGAGNTFRLSNGTVDVSISGGGGGGGSLGIQSGGTQVSYAITTLNFGNNVSISTVGVPVGFATATLDLGEYYIFRKPSVGFATMKVLIAGSNGGIAYSDYYGGSSYVGLRTSNTDQFPWVSGIGITINSSGHLIFTVP
jgi:hypothetical protein